MIIEARDLELKKNRLVESLWINAVIKSAIRKGKKGTTKQQNFLSVVFITSLSSESKVSISRMPINGRVNLEKYLPPPTIGRIIENCR